MSPRRHLLVVGHGMTGHRLMEEVHRRDRDRRWHITAVTDESRPAYDRIALTSALAGDGPARLGLRPDPCTRVRTGVSVTAVDPRSRTATLDRGTELVWDALVLATGSRPFVPPVPGHDLPGCHVLRTYDDLRAIRAAAVPGRPGLVVGGGLLGLEAAGALRHLGMRPHVVETAPHLMPMQLDRAGGGLLAGLVGALGITPHCGTPLHAVHAGPGGRVAGVTLAGGRSLPAELVIFAAGIRPRDELAAAAALPRGERGGFLVDDRCRTRAPGIWAIGECAAVRGRTYGLVAPGYRMAETVARQLTDDAEGPPLPPLDTSARLKLLGVEVASFGDAHARTPGAVEFAHRTGGTYRKLVLAGDGRTLLGGVLVGDASAYPRLTPLLDRPLPANPEDLLAPVPG
ncbi:NAD(P)/FAD-dependent oxidoreductase [Streptomyces aidingensis]|uniref:Nitrite reductase (NADH) large subunit n=1 Tax=Streptomyces aidingensis TaxID=910347 RepID=A0A1I1FLW9_9ACTN|nr:FAD-dependent oxidoreductase [Streptomyces aidingensis]SFB98030.1 nitrite reductase (NADH) large subunit [Streptomyces aidingensis]